MTVEQLKQLQKEAGDTGGVVILENGHRDAQLISVSRKWLTIVAAGDVSVSKLPTDIWLPRYHNARIERIEAK